MNDAERYLAFGRGCRAGGIPFLLSISALIIYFSSYLTNVLQYDKTAILQGELWRLITGHLTHWSSGHIFWDLLIFSVFSILISIKDGTAYLYMLMSSAVLVGTAIFIFHPHMQFYRGLSGVDSALYCYFVLDFIADAFFNQKNKEAWAGAVMLSLIVGKTLYEISIGSCLFVSQENFISLPVAHIVGIISAFAVMLWKYLFLYRHSFSLK